MHKTILMNNMIERYNKLSATHKYIFGFVQNGLVYMVITDNKVLPYIMKLDKASRGQGYSIRFNPDRKQKEFLKTLQTEILCSEKFFLEMVNNSKYNKGEIFEKLVAEYFNLDWTKDNKKFTECGDIAVNGIEYQIKFQRATFTNEKTLASLEK